MPKSNVEMSIHCRAKMRSLRFATICTACRNPRVRLTDSIQKILNLLFQNQKLAHRPRLSGHFLLAEKRLGLLLLAPRANDRRESLLLGRAPRRRPGGFGGGFGGDRRGFGLRAAAGGEVLGGGLGGLELESGERIAQVGKRLVVCADRRYGRRGVPVKKTKCQQSWPSRFYCRQINFIFWTI